MVINKKYCPIVTQIETLEYDIARALRALLSPKQSKPVIGFVTGHQEPNLLQAGGPLSTLRERLLESYELVEVPLGGVEGVPSNVDVLWEIGPQEPPFTEGSVSVRSVLTKRGFLRCIHNQLQGRHALLKATESISRHGTSFVTIGYKSTEIYL